MMRWVTKTKRRIRTCRARCADHALPMKGGIVVGAVGRTGLPILGEPWRRPRAQLDDKAFSASGDQDLRLKAEYVRTGSDGEPELVEECMWGRDPPSVFLAIGFDPRDFAPGAWVKNRCAHFTGGESAQMSAGSLRQDAHGQYIMDGWCLHDFRWPPSFLIRPHCIVGDPPARQSAREKFGFRVV